MLKNIDKYAVVELSGKQYRISEGKEVLVDKLNIEGEPGKVLGSELNYSVLLYKDTAGVKVGKPSVSDVKVSFKLLNSEEKGEKVHVYKYKSKSRYRKHIGFRPKYTRLLVEKID